LCIMRSNNLIAKPRYILVGAVSLGTWVFCALAMFYFYGLFESGVLDRFHGKLEECIVVSRTALFATLVALWAIWMGAKPKNGRGMALLQTGLATQLSLTLYALVGWEPISDWLGHVGFIYPSTFFAEYNFLTFILEVAPVTSIATSLLLFCGLKLGQPRFKPV
jgi:hypothetical protein